MGTRVSGEDLSKKLKRILEIVKENKLFGSSSLFHQQDVDLVRGAIQYIKSGSEQAETAYNRLAFVENELERALGKTKVSLSEKEKRDLFVRAKMSFMEVGSNLFLSQATKYAKLAEKAKDRKTKEKYKRTSARLMDSMWAAQDLGLPKKLQKRRKGQLMIESFFPGAESLYAEKKKPKRRRRRKR